MSRLEECDTQCPAVALEPMPQRRERAVGVHPLAQVRKNLLAGCRAVQRFELRPLSWLSAADEVDHCVREDGSLAVEPITIETDVPMSEQVCLDDGLEGGFGMPARHEKPTNSRCTANFRSTRDVSAWPG